MIYTWVTNTPLLGLLVLAQIEIVMATGTIVTGIAVILMYMT